MGKIRSVSPTWSKKQEKVVKQAVAEYGAAVSTNTKIAEESLDVLSELEPMIESDLRELQESLGLKLTKEQVDKIRYFMANYAVGAALDSEVMEEAHQICMEYEANH